MPDRTSIRLEAMQRMYRVVGAITIMLKTDDALWMETEWRRHLQKETRLSDEVITETIEIAKNMRAVYDEEKA